MRRLDRETQVVRMADAVADWLKNELGLPPKEVALRTDLDVRTVQNAFAGHLGLETYGALMDAYGHDFVDAVTERRLGTDKLTAWERDIERDKARIASAEAALARHRAAATARRAMAGGGLRLVPTEGGEGNGRGERGRGDLGAAEAGSPLGLSPDDGGLR